MKLKDIVTDIAIDPRKLIEYALNLDNPKGRDKAIMYRFHLGFTRDNYQLLLDKIKIAALEAEATLHKIDIYGQRYQVDLEITGIQPEQLEIVRTGWIVEHNSDVARLMTLYVRKRK